MKVEPLRMENLTEPVKTLPHYAFKGPFAVNQRVKSEPLAKNQDVVRDLRLRTPKKRRPAKGGDLEKTLSLSSTAHSVPCQTCSRTARTPANRPTAAPRIPLQERRCSDLP